MPLARSPPRTRRNINASKSTSRLTEVTTAAPRLSTSEGRNSGGVEINGEDAQIENFPESEDTCTEGKKMKPAETEIRNAGKDVEAGDKGQVFGITGPQGSTVTPQGIAPDAEIPRKI